jgi:Zinc finger, C3HC4 type (RING finger)
MNSPNKHACSGGVGRCRFKTLSQPGLPMAPTSPAHKRPRLDPSASPSPPPASDAAQVADEPIFPDADRKSGRSDVDPEEDEDHCVICLHHIRDRTVLPCAHDRLCFDCIFVWCQQSRKCPLCNAPIGPFLIHNFRSKYDYSKYYLPPLRLSSPTSTPVLGPLSVHASGNPRVSQI